MKTSLIPVLNCFVTPNDTELVLCLCLQQMSLPVEVDQQESPFAHLVAFFPRKHYFMRAVGASLRMVPHSAAQLYEHMHAVAQADARVVHLDERVVFAAAASRAGVVIDERDMEEAGGEHREALTHEHQSAVLESLNDRAHHHDHRGPRLLHV